MVAIAAEGTPTTMHGYARTQACMCAEYTIIHTQFNVHTPNKLYIGNTHTRTHALVQMPKQDVSQSPSQHTCFPTPRSVGELVDINFHPQIDLVVTLLMGPL